MEGSRSSALGQAGALTPVTGTPFAAGSGTFAVTLDPTGTYVYAANRTDGTISGYTIVPGTTTAALSLTPLSGSPYASGTGVQALGMDSTGKYLLAVAVGGSPDLTMYSFDIPVPGEARSGDQRGDRCRSYWRCRSCVDALG